MTSLDRLSAASLAPVPGEPETVGAIRAGQVFTVLLDPEPARRAARIEVVIDNIADLSTRIVRVGNPLRASLTIERILIQVAGPEADARIERDAAQLAAILARPAGDESRLLIVVEQPETIDGDSLALLHAMAPHFEASRPSVQVLFAGSPAFAAALDAARPPAPPARTRRLAPILLASALLAVTTAGVIVHRNQPGPSAHEPPPALAPAASAQSLPPPAPAPRASAKSQPAASPNTASSSTEVQPSEPPVAAHASAETPFPAIPATPEASAAPLPPAAAAIAPAEPDEARLRREFDTFLTSAGQPTARLPDAQRAALFQEFLAWRRARVSPEHDQAAQAAGEHREQVR